MKTITVKGTFLQPGANHFSELLNDGKSVLTPVFFRPAPGNKVEAVIDDLSIGYAEDGFEIPKLYEAKLVGPGAETLSSSTLTAQRHLQTAAITQLKKPSSTLNPFRKKKSTP